MTTRQLGSWSRIRTDVTVRCERTFRNHLYGVTGELREIATPREGRRKYCHLVGIALHHLLLTHNAWFNSISEDSERLGPFPSFLPLHLGCVRSVPTPPPSESQG
jgi:hypothetical protein